MTPHLSGSLGGSLCQVQTETYFKNTLSNTCHGMGGKGPANADAMNCFRFAATPAHIRGSAPALLRATSSLQMKLQHRCILLQRAEASRKPHKGRQPSHFSNAQLDKLCSLGYDMPN